MASETGERSEVVQPEDLSDVSGVAGKRKPFDSEALSSLSETSGRSDERKIPLQTLVQPSSASVIPTGKAPSVPGASHGSGEPTTQLNMAGGIFLGTGPNNAGTSSR